MSYQLIGEREKIFRRGVEFIARNDNPGEQSFAEIAGTISVITLAEALKIHVEKVARAVLKYRRYIMESETDLDHRDLKMEAELAKAEQEILDSHLMPPRTDPEDTSI